MVSYKIQWKNSAKKELRKLPVAIIRKIIAIIEKLPENIYPVGSKKLIGAKHTYRIRTGNYRIVYSILNKQLIIEVVSIGHRKDVYKKL